MRELIAEFKAEVIEEEEKLNAEDELKVIQSGCLLLCLWSCLLFRIKQTTPALVEVLCYILLGKIPVSINNIIILIVV